MTTKRTTAIILIPVIVGIIISSSTVVPYRGLGDKKKEEAGLRCGGRGKSEISSALRMCSNK
jgi:hypothetical protein